MGSTCVMAPQELFNSASFPHRYFPFDENRIEIMNDAIQNGISQGIFTDLLMPT
jgi:hypothetical protein